MKIIEAIERTDALLYNTCSAEEKVRWLDKLDRMVMEQVLSGSAGGTAAFSGYTAETDRDTVLLVPAPFDTMYLRWLEAQIHYSSAEYSRYNNAITLFNTEFAAFAAHCIRHRRPLGGRRFIF